MNHSKIKILLVIFIFSIISVFPAIGDEIYKWVDEKGNVHFTDNPSSIPKYLEGKEKKIIDDMNHSPKRESLIKENPDQTHEIKKEGKPSEALDHLRSQVEELRKENKEIKHSMEEEHKMKLQNIKEEKDRLNNEERALGWEKFRVENAIDSKKTELISARRACRYSGPKKYWCGKANQLNSEIIILQGELAGLNSRH